MESDSGGGKTGDAGESYPPSMRLFLAFLGQV